MIFFTKKRKKKSPNIFEFVAFFINPLSIYSRILLHRGKQFQSVDLLHIKKSIALQYSGVINTFIKFNA